MSRSRRREQSLYGALNEAAVALLERQHHVRPREVVRRARDLHAELFELERERLVMQAAERIAKQVMKDLTEDDDEEGGPSACQMVLLDWRCPRPSHCPTRMGPATRSCTSAPTRRPDRISSLAATSATATSSAHRPSATRTGSPWTTSDRSWSSGPTSRSPRRCGSSEWGAWREAQQVTPSRPAHRHDR